MAGTVRLRLALHGYRHHRIYHLVAARRFKARDSHPIETLGVYDPRLKPNTTTKTVEWSVDRIKYWLRQGAQPSKSALQLLTMGGIIDPDSNYHKAEAKTAAAEPAAPATESKA